MISTVTKTSTHAVCPYCSQPAGCIDHLEGRDISTLWYCDSCGHRYSLKIEAGVVTVGQADGQKISTLDVLVLPPQLEPVYFVVQGMRFTGPDGPRDPENEEDGTRFFYEEYSCPTNWFKPVAIQFQGDDDPHGLIEFLARRDLSAFPPDDAPFSPNDYDRAVRKFVCESKPQPPAPKGP